jgi:hypothetical protein
MTWGELVWLVILLFVLEAIAAGLIAGGWGRVAALAIISGFIGALVAASLFVPSVGGEPEDQWNIVYGFLLGTIPGALLGSVVTWLTAEHGGHAMSPRIRKVIKALTIIAAAGVAVFLGEWWDVTNLVG